MAKTRTHLFASMLLLATLLAGALSSATGQSASPTTQPATRPGAIRIACAGDSMTRLPTKGSYPEQLGKLLGDGFDVRNFGHNGVTALKDSGRPFWKMPQFEAANAFDPNVVVLMLGTNDAANKTDVWPQFEADMRWLVTHFQSLPSKPRVILMTPPPLMPGREEPENRLTNLRDKVSPIVRKIGEDQKLTVVELQTAKPLADPSLYPDKVHVNADGAKIVAERVRDALK
jgi:lysophospholipase L1-like esterase